MFLFCRPQRICGRRCLKHVANVSVSIADSDFFDEDPLAKFKVDGTIHLVSSNIRSIFKGCFLVIVIWTVNLEGCNSIKNNAIQRVSSLKYCGCVIQGSGDSPQTSRPGGQGQIMHEVRSIKKQANQDSSLSRISTVFV